MRSWGATAALVAVLAVLVGVAVAGVARDQAHASRTETCRSVAAASADRRSEVTGTGPTVAVIGDSYAQGAHLDDPAAGWPARLEGRVVVDGFAGSGFSTTASDCRNVSFDRRVDLALATEPELVVVQGGLNDFDATTEAIRAGVRRVLQALQGREVVVLGPPQAPRRATAVGRVDAILAEETAAAGVPYVRTSGWKLEYLDDRLHLTPDGHALFGDSVAAALAELVDSRGH